VESVEFSGLRCLVVTRRATPRELSTVIPAAATDVDDALRRARIKPHDDLIALYRPQGDTFELKIGRPQAEPAPDGLEEFDIPSGPVVTTVHVGAYHLIGPATDSLFTWARENGRAPAGYSWETYHHLEDPAAPRTSITLALEP
jgi:effector-binding domain-containing protein